MALISLDGTTAGQTDWALYTLVSNQGGISTELKFTSSGESAGSFPCPSGMLPPNDADNAGRFAAGSGGLEEIEDEFNDGKVMYGFVRVKDANSSLPKFVLICWVRVLPHCSRSFKAETQ